MKKCVFAGTFDPPTIGHKYVIDAVLGIFDAVTVAIMINPQKTPRLSAMDRKRLLEKLYSDEPRVKVMTFEGAAADLLKLEGTRYYVRGVRDAIDFEMETRDLFATRKYCDDLVGIMIPARQEDVHVSSTLVKNCLRFDKDCGELIPEKIREDFFALTEGDKNV